MRTQGYPQARTQACTFSRTVDTGAINTALPLCCGAFHPVDNSGRELAVHVGLNAVGHETRTHSRTVNKYINNKYIILWYSNQESTPGFAVFCVAVFKDQRLVENIAVFDAICSK